MLQNCSDKFTKKQLAQIRNGDVPEGYVWHHVEYPFGWMQLMDSVQHMWEHVGGREIWCGRTEAKGGTAVLSRVEWRYKEPLTHNKNIRHLEEYTGVGLPADYKDFIRDYNGARPKPCVVTLPNDKNVVLNRLLRVEADAVDSIKDFIDAFRNYNRNGNTNLLPFANDPFGNLFCFEYASREFKGVVFWDHEKNFTVKICATFTELIDSLHDEKF